jgi:arabinan endo-1,5-alpha-L-arabinosidase
LINNYKTSREQNLMSIRRDFLALTLFCQALISCSGDETSIPDPIDTTIVESPAFDIDDIRDTYPDLAPLVNSQRWGPYNTHDPSVIHAGDYFYSYSTDAGYGIDAPAGIQVRRSKDLIEWTFVGWALNGIPRMGSDFIEGQGGTPFNSLWAPYIMKVGDQFRLYYSLSSPSPRLSVIGLLTSGDPEGPWKEEGLVVTSLADNSQQTNAIDPTVVVDKQGTHWMYYGSAWDGIYILELDAATGLAATSGDNGHRIAQRGFSGNIINGNIEGPEVVYHSGFDKYYLFIAYDWLETKYNVRVARSDSPEGPFFDFTGKDVNTEEDNGPMVLAPYRFKDHGGWQGVSHPAVFEHEGQYYMAHQGRPGVDRFFMVMHVRKMFWTEDGWPVVSPERYAGVEQSEISRDEIIGSWEYILLGYRVVPGFAEEQVFPDFQEATTLTLHGDGSVNDQAGEWRYEAPWLELMWTSGITEKAIVARGRDWENKRSALIFSGLNTEGKAVWGKK